MYSFKCGFSARCHPPQSFTQKHIRSHRWCTQPMGRSEIVQNQQITSHSLYVQSIQHSVRSVRREPFTFLQVHLEKFKTKHKRETKEQREGAVDLMLWKAWSIKEFKGAINNTRSGRGWSIPVSQPQLIQLSGFLPVRASYPVGVWEVTQEGSNKPEKYELRMNPRKFKRKICGIKYILCSSIFSL